MCHASFTKYEDEFYARWLHGQIDQTVSQTVTLADTC